MVFQTFDHVNVPVWKQALDLYHEAFSRAGRKPDRIISGMFEKKMCQLHTESAEGEVAAMAITGVVPQGDWLLIDYLAVRKEERRRGIGRKFVRDVAEWAKDHRKLHGILIEAEADPGAENAERIRFWERCGFIPTEYVHPYIWVPETYRAMYFPFHPDFQVEDGGQIFFRSIEAFHKKAFST